MSVALPQFERPPINEVAIGVRFEAIDGLHQAHFGLFWSELRDELSTSQEAAPLPPLKGETLVEFELGLPPRTWLVHRDGEHLLQLQRDAFFFNWRRGAEESPYPRYSTIKPKFCDYFSRYLAFLEREQVSVPTGFNCSLAYVNIIPHEPSESAPSWFSRVFRDVGWQDSPKRDLPNPKGMLYKANFSLAEDLGELVVTIQSVKRRSDDLPAFRFEINVVNQRSDLSLSESDAWFDAAHEVVVKAFADLTSEEAQFHVWKRIDRS